jgi:hypothetical protein
MTLLPGPDACLGETRLADWIARQAKQNRSRCCVPIQVGVYVLPDMQRGPPAKGRHGRVRRQRTECAASSMTSVTLPGCETLTACDERTSVV